MIRFLKERPGVQINHSPGPPLSISIRTMVSWQAAVPHI